MENVTTGHWIFAGVFMFLFMVYLIWSYRKDAAVHKIQYGGTFYVMIGLVVILFLLYLLKQVLGH